MGRTETIGNTSDPDWTHQFVIDFLFNEIQYLKVTVYDDDTVTRDDGLGGATFTLGALVAAPGRTLSERLKHRGLIVIRGEEMSTSADRIRLTMRGIDLRNKDGWFGKSDPYFTISRLREDEHWQQVLRSPPVMNNLDPLWDTLEVPVQTLCNGDYLRPLRLEVWDWDRDGSHDFMGRFDTNLQGLLEGQGQDIVLEPQQPKKIKRSKGSLRVERAEIFRAPTLLQFIAGGLQISLMVAIDFTGSNGDPTHRSSLHYVDPGGRLNQYQQAIMSIGNILQEYDSDKMFPVYGFGGKRPGEPVSHCFPIYNRYGEEGEAHGVDGILEAYSAALAEVQLAGPTLFTEVLQTASARASHPVDQTDQRYHVLLILTDGIINDMTQTIDSIVAAANLPLSVVIVGVGHANFSNTTVQNVHGRSVMSSSSTPPLCQIKPSAAVSPCWSAFVEMDDLVCARLTVCTATRVPRFQDMSALDGDDGKLRDSSGNIASRDIVQFVPFSKYPQGDTGIRSRLAADTMAEIPSQLLKYFSAQRITPNPPRQTAPLPTFEHSGPEAPAFYGAGGAGYADAPPPYTG